jgi:hypothetical protein
MAIRRPVATLITLTAFFAAPAPGVAADPMAARLPDNLPERSIMTPVAIKKLLDANKVPYRTSDTPTEPAVPNPLIADRISVGVICLK